MYQKLLLLLLCLSLGFVADAQTPGFSKDFMEGEAALLKKDYKKAIRLFEKVLHSKPELNAARRYIGVCYELMGDYPKALQQYESIITEAPLFSRTLYYRAAETSNKTGDAEKALKYYGQFEFMLGKPIEDFSGVTETEMEEENEMVEKLDQGIRACLITMDSTNFFNLGKVKNLGDHINSRSDEYFPFVSSDQKLLFFTSRKNTRSDENLYYAIFDGEDWRDGLPVSNKFNTNTHEGMSTFVRDGKTMFFTACGRPGVLGPCDILQVNVGDGLEFTEAKELQGKVNSEGWESQACISCDGSTLYFSSTRPGGYGGTDIWVSRHLSDGSWSEPTNMGPSINTPKNEESPFITNDGETLYFSSDGHPGLGDSDIFLSRVDRKGNWSEPLNLGPPVNSPHRELCLMLGADGKTGFFASDRPEGLGGLDIYQFELGKELYSEPMTFVEGYVLDSLLEKPIQTTLHIKGREDIQTDENGRFFVCVHAYELLPITVEKKLFHTYQNDFGIPLWDNKNFYKIEIRLQPLQIPPTFAAKGIPEDYSVSEAPKKMKRHDYMHTIFFDFDKSQMSAPETGSLESFLQELKSKNVQRIEIIGFSDDVGTDLYNLKLSEERAKHIALQLMDNGMMVDQIYIEGKGEIRDDKPKNLNRKVEIKVTVLE